MAETAIVFSDEGAASYTMWQHDLPGYVAKMNELGFKAGIVDVDAIAGDMEGYYHDGTMIRQRPIMLVTVNKRDFRVGEELICRGYPAPVDLSVLAEGSTEPMRLPVEDADFALAFETPGRVRLTLRKFPYRDFVIDVAVSE